MDLEKRLKELQSSSPEKQIEGLKAIRQEATPEQRETLRLASEEAKSPWLKNALLDVLSSDKVKIQEGEEVYPVDETNSALDIEAIRSDAVSDSIGQILHELEPIIGSISVFAEKEIESFNDSKTKIELEKLNDVIEAFENWRQVEQSPIFKQTQIYKVLKKEAEAVAARSSVEIKIEFPEDISCTVATSLLRIIVSNALRNAVESSNQLTLREKHPIIVRGSTIEKSLWISIIDDGLGLQSKTEVLLKSRHTTKPGNRGLGLAIIEKATKSIGGKWSLKNSQPYGAEFYFELPIRE